MNIGFMVVLLKMFLKAIKYGWVDKGMKSWKDFYTKTQIAQLASF
jgi:cytochrome c oxidase cbb3-type subunit 3